MGRGRGLGPKDALDLAAESPNERSKAHAQALLDGLPEEGGVASVFALLREHQGEAPTAPLLHALRSGLARQAIADRCALEGTGVLEPYLSFLGIRTAYAASLLCEEETGLLHIWPQGPDHALLPEHADLACGRATTGEGWARNVMRGTWDSMAHRGQAPPAGITGLCPRCAGLSAGHEECEEDARSLPLLPPHDLEGMLSLGQALLEEGLEEGLDASLETSALMAMGRGAAAWAAQRLAEEGQRPLVRMLLGVRAEHLPGSLSSREWQEILEGFPLGGSLDLRSQKEALRLRVAVMKRVHLLVPPPPLLAQGALSRPRGS
jgi:hypothetical protein